MKTITTKFVKKYRKLIVWWIGVLGWIYKSPVVYYVTAVQKRILDRHKLTTNAAAISFFTLLSIVPLLCVVIAILASFVASPEEAQSYLLNFIGDKVPENARQFVFDLITQSKLISNVNSVLDNRGWIGAISVGSLLWTSSGAFAAVEDAMTTIFGVKARNYFVSRLVEMGLVIVIGALFLIASFISGIVAWLHTNNVIFLGVDFARLPYIWELITEILPYSLVLLTYYVVYKILPRTNVHFRAAITGAVVAGVLLYLALGGFSYYVSNFSKYNAFYGSIAGVVISMFTIYLASIILLIGAEMTEIVNTEIVSREELRVTIKEFL